LIVVKPLTWAGPLDDDPVSSGSSLDCAELGGGVGAEAPLELTVVKPLTWAGALLPDWVSSGSSLDSAELEDVVGAGEPAEVKATEVKVTEVKPLPWTGELPEEAEDVEVDDVDEEEELCSDSPPGSFELLSESSISTEHVSTSCTAGLPWSSVIGVRVIVQFWVIGPTTVWVVEDVCTDSDELSPSSVAFDWRRTMRAEEASPRGNAFTIPATKRRRTRNAGMMLRLRLVVSI